MLIGAQGNCLASASRRCARVTHFCKWQHSIVYFADVQYAYKSDLQQQHPIVSVADAQYAYHIILQLQHATISDAVVQCVLVTVGPSPAIAPTAAPSCRLAAVWATRCFPYWTSTPRQGSTPATSHRRLSRWVPAAGAVEELLSSWGSGSPFGFKRCSVTAAEQVRGSSYGCNMYSARGVDKPAGPAGLLRAHPAVTHFTTGAFWPQGIERAGMHSSS